MNFLTIICMCILLLASSGAKATAQTPPVFTCAMTAPADARPAANVNPFGEDESVYFEDGIWVSIPDEGILELPAGREIGFGLYQGWRTESITWLRDEGVEGFVIVSGQRLDQGSRLQPATPLSPERQYTKVGYLRTGIAFPSSGCWEVTGTVGDHSITWVMDVRFVGEVATPAN